MHILILPGWRQNTQHWRQFLATFAAPDITCTILDFPGFGIVPIDKNIETFTDAQKWVETYIQKHLYDQEIILIGHSFGGRIASAIASTSPAYLKGIVLIGAPCIYRPNFDVVFKRKLAGLFYFLPSKVRNTFRSHDYKQVQKSDLKKLFKSTIANDQTSSLKHISVPTLLVWGENDSQVNVKVAREISALIQNSTLDVISSAGHDVHIEKPLLLAGKISSYVKTI